MTRAASIEALQSGWARLLSWDAAVLVAARGLERAWLRRLMRALTRAGDTAGWLVHGIILWVLLDNAGSRVELLIAGAGLGVLGSQGLKRLCCRARPDHAIAGFEAGMANPDKFSFPSGHSTVAFAVATAVASADPLLGTLELGLAVAIAASRVGLGAHYPLDVAAGIFLGIASGTAASVLVGAA